MPIRRAAWQGGGGGLKQCTGLAANESITYKLGSVAHCVHDPRIAKVHPCALVSITRNIIHLSFIENMADNSTNLTIVLREIVTAQPGVDFALAAPLATRL